MGLDWVGEMLRKSIDGNRYKAGASLGRLKGCVLYGDGDGDGWIERRMALGSRHPNFSFVCNGGYYLRAS